MNTFPRPGDSPAARDRLAFGDRRSLMYRAADRIGRWRRAAGWSQAQLAAAVERDPSTVSRWESANRLPSAAMHSRLCRLFGRDAGCLLDAHDSFSAVRRREGC